MECSLAVKVNLNYTRNVEMSFFFLREKHLEKIYLE